MNKNSSLIALSKEKIMLFKRIKIIDKKTAQKNDKKRYYIFDNFKGILIFSVVFGHFLWLYSCYYTKSTSRKIILFIYYFHMPGFVFISGFLTTDNSLKISNVMKLLILYYIFNFLVYLISYYYYNYHINFRTPTNTYWYILSLFYWRLIIKSFYKIGFILNLSIIISLLEGYWNCFNNDFSLVRTIAFFPFFLAGFKLAKSQKFDKFLKWRKGILKVIIIVTSFCGFLYLFNKFINKNQKKINNSLLLMFAYNKNNKINDRLYFMIIASIFIFYFLSLLPNIKLPLITKWGKNSLYVYLFDRIFYLYTEKRIFNRKKYSNHIIKYSILFTFVLLFIFGSDFVNKYLNLILNFIHKNLVEFNNKGKMISFLFILSFIFLLSVTQINRIYNLLTK